MKRIVTFGELLLRLAPEGYRRFTQTDRLFAHFGGSEANVAISLATLGMDAAFVTRLPEHAIGQAALNDLRRFGVDTSLILRGGERVGIYYYEPAVSCRPAQIIYDRAGSSVAASAPEEFDWDAIFADADWFHFSGITPALSASLADICLQAVKAAHAHGVTVSCDLNYREKLWSKEDARQVMRAICPFVDVCIGNEGDAADALGIFPPQGGDWHDVARQMTAEFGFSAVAFVQRSYLTPERNDITGIIYQDGVFFESRTHDLHALDRIGAGDSFCAGLIYGMLNDYPPQDTAEFAAAASALCHSFEGDVNLATLAEIRTLAEL